MKLIPLTQGQFAKVDDEDFERLSKLKWYAVKAPHTYYARTTLNGKNVTMHRYILGLEEYDSMEGDHEDHDGLNNQKYNLRKSTRTQNSKNRRAYGTSKYLGVCKGPTMTKKGKVYDYSHLWFATISLKGRNKKIGQYLTEEEAARAYDAKAKELHGDFANLNFKEHA